MWHLVPNILCGSCLKGELLLFNTFMLLNWVLAIFVLCMVCNKNLLIIWWHFVPLLNLFGIRLALKLEIALISVMDLGLTTGSLTTIIPYISVLLLLQLLGSYGRLDVRKFSRI